MGSPAIFKGNFVKLLKSRFEMFNNWKLFTDVTSDPTSVSQDATAGSLYARSGTNQLYKKFDSGDTVNWKLLDQPSPFVEIDPLGDIDSMPDTTPLSNTGGTLTLTTTSSEVGIGLQGIKFVASATSQIVERDSLVVPLGLRANGLMGFKAMIKNNTNWTVRLVDDTNAVNIIEEVVNTGDVFKVLEFSGEMGPTCAACHWEFESSAADTLLISKASITPDISLISKSIANITDWEVVTTPASSWTSSTRQEHWRRVGDTINVTGSITGTGTATTLTVTIPNGLSIDTSKFDSAGGQNVGKVTLTDAGTATYAGAVIWNGTATSLNIRYYNDNSTLETPTNTTTTVPFTWNNTTDRIDYNYSVPIEGWTSELTNVVTSSDNVATAEYEGNANASIVSGTTTIVNYDTKVRDNDSLVTTGASWSLEIPKSGEYEIHAYNQLGSSSAWTQGNSAELVLFKNGVEYKKLNTWENNFTVLTTIQVNLTGSYKGFFNKGDLLDIRVFQNTGSSIGLLSGASSSWFSCSRTDKKPITGLGNETCYLKHKESSGVNGGTFNLGSYVTRTLNLQEGSTTFCSLSANQFTLQAGKYSIHAEGQTQNVSKNKMKIFNVSDSTDAIIGISSDGGSISSEPMSATLDGEINITSSKTFELRHRSSASQSGEGFGRASGFGDDEIYAVVKIVKLK